MERGKEDGESWPLLQAGFFGGKLARLEAAEDLLAARLADAS